MTAAVAERALDRLNLAGVLPEIPAPDGYDVAASTTILGGTLVCLNSSGYAVPGSTSTSLVCVGVAIETVDNSAGAAGAKKVRTREGPYAWDNSAGADEILVTDVGKDCYIVDNQTVAKLATGRSIAGIVLAVGTSKVYVAVGPVFSRLAIDATYAATFTSVKAALAAADSSIAVNSQKLTGIGLPSATPSNVGTASKGSSGEAAMSDHVHAITFAVVNAALAAANASISVNSQKITNVLDPASNQDAATKAYVDPVVGKLGGTYHLLSESAALGTSQPLSITDATMTGLTAGGSIAGAGTAGIVCGSFANATVETGAAAAQAGLGSAAAATQPYNATDFPGQRYIHAEIKRADGDDVLLADMLTTAPAADIEAKVYGYLSYRSDLGADAKWRLWYYYRANATGFETPFTPDIAVTGARLYAPRVMSLATLPVGAAFGVPIAGQGAAELVWGTSGDIAAVGTAAGAGTTGKVADAGHVHAHGAQTDGALHAAVVAAGASGFMTGADKTKLDGLSGSGALYGAYGAMPAAGVSGRLYFCTDAPRVYVDSGTAWRPLVPGGMVGTAPPASWTNVAAMAEVAALGAVEFTAPILAGAHCCYGYQAYVDGTTVVVHLRRRSIDIGTKAIGICLADVGTNIAAFAPFIEGVSHEGYGYFSTWTDDATRTALDVSVPSVTGRKYDFWLRVRKDGTDYKFGESVDGLTWIENAAWLIAAASLTPTKVGIWIGDTGAVSVSLDSWVAA